MRAEMTCCCRKRRDQHLLLLCCVHHQCPTRFLQSYFALCLLLSVVPSQPGLLPLWSLRVSDRAEWTMGAVQHHPLMHWQALLQGAHQPGPEAAVH